MVQKAFWVLQVMMIMMIIIFIFIFFNLEQGKEAFPKLREILRRTRLCCQWLVNHAASQGEGLA